MEIGLILFVLLIPVVVGFFSGFMTNATTIERCPTMSTLSMIDNEEMEEETSDETTEETSQETNELLNSFLESFLGNKFQEEMVIEGPKTKNIQDVKGFTRNITTDKVSSDLKSLEETLPVIQNETTEVFYTASEETDEMLASLFDDKLESETVTEEPNILISEEEMRDLRSLEESDELTEENEPIYMIEPGGELRAGNSLTSVSTISDEVDKGVAQLLKYIVDQTTSTSDDKSDECQKTNSVLPGPEHGVICKLFGESIADCITTTPALGATTHDADVMIGKALSTEEGIYLSYKDEQVLLKGHELDFTGEIVLVKGFFISKDLFMVDNHKILSDSMKVKCA